MFSAKLVNLGPNILDITWCLKTKFIEKNIFKKQMVKYISSSHRKCSVKKMFLKKLFVCFNESPLKMMKNVFYFIIKALFVLKISKFLP